MANIFFFSKNMLRETRAQLISQWAKLAKSEKFEMISFKEYIFIQLEQSSSKHFLYPMHFLHRTFNRICAKHHFSDRFLIDSLR